MHRRLSVWLRATCTKESPDSDTIIGTVEIGDLIEVEREDLVVDDEEGTIMRVVHPRGAVQFDLAWFEVIPDKREPIVPCDDLDDGFDMPFSEGVGTADDDCKKHVLEACAVAAPEEASVTSCAGVSRGSPVGGAAVTSDLHVVDAVRKRVERCRVLLGAAQRQADRSEFAKKADEMSEKIRSLEKRQDELRRKTAYCNAGVPFEGGICSRRESHRRRFSWASALLAEQESLRESACPDETPVEAELRELLLAAVNAEVVEKNAVSVHETSRKRVREDDATCAESDDVCMQLQHLKLELNIARESASRIVEPASSAPP